MQLKFTIKGKAKAKQSVKFTRGGIKYTPKDIVEYANLAKVSFINAYPNWQPSQFLETPLTVEINVYKAIPASFSKKKQERAIAGEIRPTVKPDCDNIAKNINDALNGIVYPDDKQIVSLTINKFYSYDERVEVSISGCVVA